MKLLCWLWLFLLPVLPVMARNDQAREAATRSDMAAIATAMDAFKVDCGRYPATAEGMAALLHCPTNILAVRWHGPYLDEIPQDPWANPYVYECPGRYNTKSYDLYSCGPDGISKTHGSDLDDINNWDSASPHVGNHNGADTFLTLQLVFWGNFGLFGLAVTLSVRRGSPPVPPLFKRRQWEGMISILLFALGVGLAMFWPENNRQPSVFVAYMSVFAFCLWEGTGLLFAISGMRSGRGIGSVAGLVALFEFLSVLWWLLVPKMEE